MSILLGALLAAIAATALPPHDIVEAPKQANPQPPAVTKPTREQVLAAVRAEWPRYDRGAKGRLTPLEFSTWVMNSHGRSVAPRSHAGGIAPVSAMNAASTAFARADADHDGGVTPDEMTRFLMMPPAPPVSSRHKALAPPPTPAKPIATVAGD